MKFSKEQLVKKKLTENLTVFEYCYNVKSLPVDGALAHLNGSFGPKINKVFTELFFVLEGEVKIETDQEMFTLQEGDLFIMLPEKKHTVHGTNAKIFIACSPQFDPRNVEMI